MDRIEEFTHEGKNFIYLDLSNLNKNADFIQVIEESKLVIKKYTNGDLYTITNIEGVKYDSKTKRLVAEWTEHNKPYVKYGAVTGVDGIKQIMINAIFTISGRKNMTSASTREEAIEWLLKQA